MQSFIKIIYICRPIGLHVAPNILGLVEILFLIKTKCWFSRTLAMSAHDHLVRSTKWRLLHMLFLSLQLLFIYSIWSCLIFLVWNLSIPKVGHALSHWSQTFLTATVCYNFWGVCIFLSLSHLTCQHFILLDEVLRFATWNLFSCANISLGHWCRCLTRSLIFNFEI